MYVANMPTNFVFNPMRRNLLNDLSSTRGPNGHSIQAWLDDQFPDRHLCVHLLAMNALSRPLRTYRANLERVEAGLQFSSLNPELSKQVRRESSTPAEYPLPCGTVESAGFTLQGEQTDRTTVSLRESTRSLKALYLLIIDPKDPVFINIRDLP